MEERRQGRRIHQRSHITSSSKPKGPKASFFFFFLANVNYLPILNKWIYHKIVHFQYLLKKKIRISGSGFIEPSLLASNRQSELNNG